MRGRFIKMYITPDNILLTEPFTHEPVHIHCPFFYFRLSLKRSIGGIVTGTIHNSLVSKSKLTHLFFRTTQYEIHNCAEFWFCQTLIRVFHPTPSKVFRHALRNGLILVYRPYPTAFYNLKIQSFPLAVISSLVYGVFPAAFCPVALLFVALRGGYAFHHVHVHHLP